MDITEVYHGSYLVVTKPKILTNGYYKDFGYGFYCTNIEKQTICWAISRRKTHIVEQAKSISTIL